MLLAACSGPKDDGIVDVAIIGSVQNLDENGLRLSYAGQHLRAATSQGLVRLDQSGQVVPGLAERWIVTDDGASYIFRIREFDLDGGDRLTAQQVADALNRTLDRLEGTSLGADLEQVRDIRAMTGRVVEFRLNSPMPDFLQLLAQPELGLVLDGADAGPMRRTREGETIVLEAMAPEQRGLPERPGWDENVQPVRVHAVPARAATEGFSTGRYDLVLNGRLASLPLADAGALARGTLRLGSTLGIFGLEIARAEGFLADPANREVLSMAIDRAGLIEPFNIDGWEPTTRIVAPGLTGDDRTVSERWTNRSMAERRATASARVSRWEAANGPVSLRIALPEGPGSDMLFQGLERDFAAIGIDTVRAGENEAADLRLRDRAARYGNARWFLNQFSCEVARAACSSQADYLVELAVESTDPEEKASYLAEAEAALTLVNGFIPFGPPIRWSLARAGVEEFVENPWDIHPLFPLSRAPI